MWLRRLPAGQIDWPKYIFFKLKLLIFRRWSQLWMKSTTIKQRMNLPFFVVFPLLFCCRTRWVNWLTIDENVSFSIIKTTAAHVYAHEQLRLRFYVLVRYFVVLDIHLWKLFALGSVNIGEYSPIFTSPLANNCPSYFVMFMSLCHR